MIILLAPEKIISSTKIEQWDDLKDCGLILFTSSSEAYEGYLKDNMQSVFNHMEYFDYYPNNDTVELKLLEYAKKYPIKNIIPMTEADILRVSAVKEKLGIDGLKFHDALKFRDKIAMKELANNHKIPMPKFKLIKHSIDLIEFIEEVGYPIIIKPILGRGSLSTLLLVNQNDLLTHLNTGLISNTSRYPDLLAEEFLDAEIYHIDGLQLHNKIKVISVSKYINNCLSFVGGSYLGSYTLDTINPLRTRLIDFSAHLLHKIFPSYKNTLFHIEVFVDRNKKISLCEIACRLGGNGINDEVKLQQGVDIKMEFIKAECGINAELMLTNTYPIAGRLLVPPKEARLISFPEICGFPGVIHYQFRGKVGQSYKKMLMSNDEIANFLLASSSETEICERIRQLSHWFDNQVIWKE